MSESLDVVGLECEEAMFYIKDVLRKGHGLPLAVRSASAPFHQLLSLWASSTDHVSIHQDGVDGISSAGMG